VSDDRQADSDTLLLIFEIKGELLWFDRSKCVLAAQDGTEYDWVGFNGGLKSETPTGPVDMTLVGLSRAIGMGPSETGEAAMLAFRLPPPSSRPTLKGLKGFPPIPVEVK
jgi:hypothetical protein